MRIKFEKDGGDGSGGGGSNPSGITVKIGEEERSFSPDQVKELFTSNQTLTQQAESVGALKSLADQMNMDPKDLAAEAQGLFGLVGQLHEQGIIDDEGNVVAPKAKPTEGDPPKTPPADGSKGLTKEDVLELLKQELDPSAKAIQDVTQSQTALRRNEVVRMLQSQYEGLTFEDAKEIMIKANLEKVSIKDAAKAYMGGKKSVADAAVEAYKEQLRKAGHDPDSFDLNRLEEQDAEGVAQAIVKDKKVSFRGGDGAVTPKEAMRAFMTRQRTGG